jgi:hypothetical protein
MLDPIGRQVNIGERRAPRISNEPTRIRNVVLKRAQRLAL